MATTTNYWILTSGRWTEQQLDKVVLSYHRMWCSSFDGGHANKILRAGPMTPDEQRRHESTILQAIQALEAAGFSVTEGG